MSAVDETRRTFTADERKNAAKSGAAMPDGSFPIHNTDDLKNAIKLAGNAKDPAAARAHIKKRAKALGASSMIPDDWGQQQEDGKNSADMPLDSLVRFVQDGGSELRSPDERDGRLGTLAGHFAVFNQRTKIDSAFEGKFFEQFAPGAFKKTFEENRGGMRVLFQHGKDGQIGDKPLGPIDVLREEDTGAYYEVPLLDTSYNRDLIPGLEAGLYGASFRFRVTRQKLDKRGANEEGLPERTVLEAAVKEFGPVTFPAYEGATAGMRSITDDWLLWTLAAERDRLGSIVDRMPRERFSGDDHTTEYTTTVDAPPESRRTIGAPVSGRRVGNGVPLYGAQKRRSPTWLLPR